MAMLTSSRVSPSRNRALEKVGSQIPCIDLSAVSQHLVHGSDEWKSLCDTLRQAAEEYGCFQVMYNQISTDVSEEMFKAGKELMDLPQETKEKNINSNPFYEYTGKIEGFPLYESLGFRDALSLESAQAFTNLMWADGNPAFCQTLHAFASKLQGLGLLILHMIMESHGLGKYYDSYVEGNYSVVRVNKYKAPKGDLPETGLPSHVDKTSITVIYNYNDSVRGLDVQLKSGEWITALQKGMCTIFIGDALNAWSNGKFHAARHRVMMNEDKTRYSLLAALVPKDGTIIEAPKELIDDEHPQLYRPFEYMDYVKYYFSTLNEVNALEAYAGI